MAGDHEWIYLTLDVRKGRISMSDTEPQHRAQSGKAPLTADRLVLRKRGDYCRLPRRPRRCAASPESLANLSDLLGCLRDRDQPGNGHLGRRRQGPLEASERPFPLSCTNDPAGDRTQDLLIKSRNAPYALRGAEWR